LRHFSVQEIYLACAPRTMGAKMFRRHMRMRTWECLRTHPHIHTRTHTHRHARKHARGRMGRGRLRGRGRGRGRGWGRGSRGGGGKGGRRAGVERDLERKSQHESSANEEEHRYICPANMRLNTFGEASPTHCSSDSPRLRIS
jgi:hypothetical protein